jgi:murein DD-endopeptidase MepM/ murein hydrolase activator NlpD
MIFQDCEVSSLIGKQGKGWKSTRWMKQAVFLICLLSIWFLPNTAIAQTSGPVYIVQPGDTLYLIAQRFGTSVEALASANGITDPTLITPGLELVIPGYEAVSGVLDFHELEFGETISSLSAQLGMPPDALIRLNRILQPERLYIGQALIIATSADEESGPSNEVLLPAEGESKLAFAARNHVNPWDVGQFQNRLNRAWIISDERLVLPGGDTGFHSLPLPLEQIDVNPARVIQGQTLEVTITSRGNEPIVGMVGDQQLHFYVLSQDQMIALQGIHALTGPGMYDLEIGIWDAQKGESRFSYSHPIRIVDGGYYYDPVLYVPEETIVSETTQAEDALIDSIVKQITEDKYWDGIFQFPSSYTDSFPSYFGSRRNYNNQGYNWYHTGLDLYGGVGTPIFAPAKGRVVYTGALDVRGNVTFIDHGWGIFTGYLHQSAIEVSIGDWVEAGQQIGLVGATGRVTGPHLHWEIWVGGVPVDPLEWTSEVFP